MRTDQAKRLTKLAAKKIGNSVYVEHTVAYHTYLEEEHYNIRYSITYFYSDSDCKILDFDSWTKAEAFIKNLALKGLPDVQESDAASL